MTFLHASNTRSPNKLKGSHAVVVAVLVGLAGCESKPSEPTATSGSEQRPTASTETTSVTATDDKAEQNPQAAKRAGRAIARGFSLLETDPDIGRPLYDLPHTVRDSARLFIFRAGRDPARNVQINANENPPT